MRRNRFRDTRIRALKVLVVGITGFLGSHLGAHLRTLGHQVEGWARRDPAPDTCDRHVAVDLRDPGALAGLRGPWDAAVLLAGHSVPGADWNETMTSENVTIARHTLDHLAASSPGARALVVSSAHVYAPGPGRRREEDPLAPGGGYGRSKLAIEGEAAARRERLDVQVVRPFNQIGPGLPSGLVARDLLDRLRAREGPLVMGGSDSLRDFLDVRDGVRGLSALLEVDAPSGSVWNLCSGRGVRIAELARTFLEVLGQEREVRFSEDEPTELVGDPSRLAAATGFAPEHGLSSSLVRLAEEDHG